MDRYNRGIYAPVIFKASAVIADEKDNPFRSKYMLLKAMSLGQTSDNKDELIPVLQQVVSEYPKTPEQIRADELLLIIRTGVSKNDPIDFTSKSIYTYDEKSPHWVKIFLTKDQTSNAEKSKVSDFNREFFSRDKLKINSKIYGSDQSIIIVEDFESDLKSLEYIRVFKNTRKYLLDLQKAKIVPITKENLRILFETQKLKEYEDFILEYY